MKRISRSFAVLALSVVGLALHFVSPVVAAAITGVAAAGGMFVTMSFNVLTARIIHRAVILLHAIAVYLMSGSIPFALAALFAGGALWIAGELLVKAAGGVGPVVVRLVMGIAAFSCLAIAWPLGWSGLVVLPIFLVM